MTDHVSLVHLLSTLLQAVCRPLPPGCEFWCGRMWLLTRQAKPNSSSAASPCSMSCEGCFLTTCLVLHVLVVMCHLVRFHWLCVMCPSSLPLPVYLPIDSAVVKKQPSQDVLHGDKAEEELGLARLVSSYTLPHQNSQPGERGRQTARSKVLSRHARDT